MKNILKATILLCILIVSSCDSRDDTPTPSANGFDLTSIGASSIVLAPQNDSELAVQLNWNRSNNGVATVADYKVEIAKSGTNFDDSVFANSGNNIIVTADERKYDIEVLELNNLVNQLPGAECGVPIQIDIRVKSILGDSRLNPFIQYSTNTISITATPYSNAAPILAFASSSSNLDSAAKLACSSISKRDDFEGFMFLAPGTYKFYTADACNRFSAPTVYGISGTSGALILDGVNGFTVSTAGHYYVTANLSETGTGALTYSISAFNTGANGFGIYGKATRGFGFINTSPMTYDPTTKKWNTTIELINGQKFSFKTSSTVVAATLVGSGTATFTESVLTTFSGTGTAPTEGTIKAPGDFVNNDTKTRYNVEVDVSRPRDYTYKITAAPN